MTKLLLDATGEIKWPVSCARCGSTANLTVANATSGRVTSVRPNFAGGISVASELLDLSYPVCAEHARGLALANQLTRNTLGLKFLRGFTYFLGPLSVFFIFIRFLSLVLSLFRPAARLSSTTPVVFYAISLGFATALFLIVLAFRKVPVRVARHTADVVELKFRNERYAREFAKLNRKVIR